MIDNSAALIMHKCGFKPQSLKTLKHQFNILKPFFQKPEFGKEKNKRNWPCSPDLQKTCVKMGTDHP